MKVSRGVELFVEDKEDNFVLYRLVPPKFTIPVASSVAKHFDFVSVYILAIPELFRLYRDKYRISTD